METTTSPLSLHDEFVACVNLGDLSTLAELLEPDAVMGDRDGTRVGGRAAVAGRLAQLLSLAPTMTSRIRVSVIVQNIALVVSEWEVHGVTPAGDDFRDSGTSYDTYRRGEDGRWRIAIDNPRHVLPASDGAGLG